jgi:hypothetical protein
MVRVEDRERDGERREIGMRQREEREEQRREYVSGSQSQGE